MMDYGNWSALEDDFRTFLFSGPIEPALVSIQARQGIVCHANYESRDLARRGGEWDSRKYGQRDHVPVPFGGQTTGPLG